MKSAASRIIVAAAVLASGLCALPPPAHGYEFSLRARTVGQGYQMRWLRFGEQDRLLNRRRFTQTLEVDVWDILRPSFDPARPDAARRAPFDLYFTASLRIDHDFGDFVGGEIDYLEGGSPERELAVSVVPELDEGRLALDAPWAYLGGRGLGGRVDFRLGRQLVIDTLDWYGFDGLAVTVHTPWNLAASAHGGLLVRSASLWGAPGHEPDGTSGSDCRRVEDGGTTWIESDDCAQRRVLMPGFGAALETEGWRRAAVRLSYRRVQSPTSEAFPDGAPAWGVNEEKLVLSARGLLAGGALMPEAAVRYNGVLGQVDEARASLRLASGQHAITPEVAYVYPSFDADSIFAVFATSPYVDTRATWDVWPGRGPLRGYLRGVWRQLGDGDVLGGGGGVRWHGRRARVRLDLFHEDGQGGLRAGGDASGRYRLRRAGAEVEGRLTLIRHDDDLVADRGATTFGVQAGVRWPLAPGATVHLLVEDNVNRFDRSAFRVLAILDLAFVPEI